MQNEKTVTFKGKKNGITVVLDKETEFSEVKAALGQKMEEARHFFNGGKAKISFRGRKLTAEQEKELLEIIAKDGDIRIIPAAEEVEEAVRPEPTMADVLRRQGVDQMTRFHSGSLRSGQSLRFDGSVVVVGDVNPGAEIIAHGNIIVLGAAKGLVHAGCAGNTECFVAAADLMPIQLRIGEIMTIPVEAENKGNLRRKTATYAYVSDQQIFIAPLLNEKT